MANYTFREKLNRNGAVYDVDKKDKFYVEDITQLEQCAVDLNDRVLEVEIPSSASSFLYAKLISNYYAPVGSSILKFTNIVTDSLGEYDSSTGIFTATVAGRYSINTHYTWLNLQSDKTYYGVIVLNGNPVYSNYYSGYRTATLTQVLSAVVDLAVGDTLKIGLYNGDSFNRDISNGYYTTLNIARV